MKKVRNCNGCKAYYPNRCRYRCELGYELTKYESKNFMGISVPMHKPKDGECTKPKTYDELFKAIDARQMLNDEGGSE